MECKYLQNCIVQINMLKLILLCSLFWIAGSLPIAPVNDAVRVQ